MCWNLSQVCVACPFFLCFPPPFLCMFSFSFILPNAVLPPTRGTGCLLLATRICFLFFLTILLFFPPFSVVHFLVLLPLPLPLLLLLLESVECLRKVTKVVSSSAASLPLPPNPHSSPLPPFSSALAHSAPSLLRCHCCCCCCDTWLRHRPGARSSTFSVPFCSTWSLHFCYTL